MLQVFVHQKYKNSIASSNSQSDVSYLFDSI